MYMYINGLFIIINQCIILKKDIKKKDGWIYNGIWKLVFCIFVNFK